MSRTDCKQSLSSRVASQLHTLRAHAQPDQNIALTSLYVDILENLTAIENWNILKLRQALEKL